MVWEPSRRGCLGGLLVVLFAALLASGAEEPPPVRMVVMDPLCERLACDCVGGYAQRNYGKLAEFLEGRLQRSVEVVYAEALASPQVRLQQGVHLIIGKFSEVVFDAREAKLKLRTLAMLSDRRGAVTQTGLFVVRAADPAKGIEDLRGRRILFGPQESDEKRTAAAVAMEAFGLPISGRMPHSPGCSTAALAVEENEADVAVISSYAMPLLEGCGTIEKGSLRILGRTDPVPFIAAFVTDRVGTHLAASLRAALLEVGSHASLSAALESRDGFVDLPANGRGDTDGAGGWTDWRGPRRDALSAEVPKKLPAQKRLLWAHTLTGPGMSGLAVADGYVIAADKDLEEQDDVFHCLDADTGKEIWRLTYRASGEMDFSNSPRANPVIHQGLVYLLGAFGDLHCLKLDSGEVVWKKKFTDDFRCRLPQWGWSSTPLLVGDKLIVNPGAKDASIVALDRLSGKVLWATPGDPPGYAGFILAEFGGVRQIVGYDVASLGGWDGDTGRRLWRLVPELDGDFNVPTPIVVDGKLLVSTENNGTRLYAFDQQGRILPQPLAVNEDLVPDTSTPVVLDGMVFGSCGSLWCLDLQDGLRTLWECDDDPLMDYCTLIAGNGHVLVTAQSGIVYLLEASKKGFSCTSRLELFDDVSDTQRDVWSHPALVGNRLYVRNLLGVYCFLLQ